MDGYKKEFADDFRENIYTDVVKAGKRTYYFDVKETSKGEQYITITERKRIYNEDGTFRTDKHKMFLYKEDFDKFTDALKDIIAFVDTGERPIRIADTEETSAFDASQIQFED